ncbi:MAG: hypothetical protein IIZ61_05005 [Lachnospiraceae bacterium]|nr:hypothetical protein [Lachnospiraceae bacterium]
MDLTETKKKTPSRKECEEAIKKILSREMLLEEGRNHHFKTAVDFMGYFESLYPASAALTKQVQRAVKNMDMPKDENGYFIINKTKTELRKEQEITRVLVETEAHLKDYDSPLEVVFLEVDKTRRGYLMELFYESEAVREKFVTMVEAVNGIVFYTENRNQLSVMLRSLLREESAQ